MHRAVVDDNVKPSIDLSIGGGVIAGRVGVDFLLGKNGFKLGYSLGYGNSISIIWEDVE